MKNRFRGLYTVPAALLVLLVVLDGIIFYFYPESGFLVIGLSTMYVIIAFGIGMAMMPYAKSALTDYATAYGVMQRYLLDEFEVPYVLMDVDGKVLWQNQRFVEHFDTSKGYHKSITTLIPTVTKEMLHKVVDEHHLYITEEDVFYHLIIRRVFIDDSAQEAEDRKEAVNEYESLFVMYMFDETQLQESLKENEEQKLVSALVYIDNYEEALESIEEVKRSLLIALVDRKVNKYFGNTDGIVKKIEKDKYFIVFKRKYLDDLESDRFSLIEDVKSIKIGNEMAITLSIGIGNGSRTYTQNYEYTRAAIDLALGRGGDQAVVKTPEKISYYGGKTQQVDKSTRVKARVKAQALREILESKEQVIVMGHSISDVDALGAAVGIYRAANVLGKRAYIVLNSVSSSLRPVKDRFNEENGYNEKMFVTSNEAMELVDKNTVVVVVDTNKPSFTECPELLTQVKTIVVFDHHRQGAEVIENAVLSYIEPYASSTCEMISEVLQYFSEDIKLGDVEADTLYAGILIDTNNFMTKTGVRTFEAAAYLRRSGADVVRVRKMLRNDMESYKARADAVRQAEVYRDVFAISTCESEHLESPTIAGAQAANELLDVVGIKASFVLTDYRGKIFISSRSIDEVNVQIIMERLGGGGHLNVAGAQLEDMTIEEARVKLKETLDIMIEEGDIEQ
ncbi:MAG: DHH family phosphoesterase [Lachnospiraceae bacterium]|jgi:c-di-AMP phosphodiesterase-like protein|nr:DHH family phosphoesterase [Lachnospiraceae bacterium]